MFDAYIESQERHRNDLIFIAWHTAYLQRVKKFPKFDELVNKKPRRMTDEQMLAKAKALNMMFGGKVCTKQSD